MAWSGHDLPPCAGSAICTVDGVLVVSLAAEIPAVRAQAGTGLASAPLRSARCFHRHPVLHRRPRGHRHQPHLHALKSSLNNDPPPCPVCLSCSRRQQATSLWISSSRTHPSVAKSRSSSAPAPALRSPPTPLPSIRRQADQIAKYRACVPTAS